MQCEFCGVTGFSVQRCGRPLIQYGWMICGRCLEQGHTIEEVVKRRGFRFCPICSRVVEAEPNPSAEHPLLPRAEPACEGCAYCTGRGDRFVTLPRTCPDCGSGRLRDVLYGLPPDWPDPASFWLGNPGRREIRWYCLDCYYEW